MSDQVIHNDTLENVEGDILVVHVIVTASSANELCSISIANCIIILSSPSFHT